MNFERLFEHLFLFRLLKYRLFPFGGRHHHHFLAFPVRVCIEGQKEWGRISHAAMVTNEAIEARLTNHTIVSIYNQPCKVSSKIQVD